MTLIFLVSVVVAALLSVPRPEVINELPAPRVNWERARAEHDANAAALTGIENQPLSYEVRSVGELVRRLGEAEASAASTELAALRRELSWAVRVALKQGGPASLEKLMRLQARLFVRAAQSWDVTQQPTAELRQLGGKFAERAMLGNWLGSDVEDLDAALSTMFRIRWISVTGLSGVAELEPTADDWRRYYGFRLKKPDGQSERAKLELQLALVKGLEKYDSTYPVGYAQGVLYYRLGDYSSAYQSYRRHLTKHPHGRFALRARNGAAASATKMLGG